MHPLDWAVIGAYVLTMAAIGLWSYRKVRTTQDFFAAGGKLPWWLSGISHHMSGYSAVVFVGYAGIAYTHGLTVYMWWALPVGLAVLTGAACIAPRWARLREKQGVVSPTEYLAVRYGRVTQQAIAYSGVLLKLFDVAGKWAAIGILLQGFAGIPLEYGVAISGLVSLLYITVGGLWADVLTDFAQFIVQLLAGLAMAAAVVAALGGPSAAVGMWSRLPPEHHFPFTGDYTIAFALSYFLVSFLSANGGTWNLAQRYIASPRGKDATRAGLVSGALYLGWPIVLFFPMWAAPILFPGLPDPDGCYTVLTRNLLPPGLVGLVLASMFAHTMAMTTSDTSAVTAVVTRDILPCLSVRFRDLNGTASLRAARIAMVTFLVATMAIGVLAKGRVFDLIVLWFGALVGPVAVPMILGLLRPFRRSNSAVALASWAAGLAAFALVRFSLDAGKAAVIGTPVAVSLVVFVAGGWVRRGPVSGRVDDLLNALSQD